jgi:hypothetical protein
MNELIAFNINVNVQTFFGSANLPQIEDAKTIPPGEESLVDDFAAFVLRQYLAPCNKY